MLKAEQIPDEVVKAFEEEYHFGEGDWKRNAIAAAINAWPGMSTGPNIYGRQDAVMHLPLHPQEGEETDWGKPQGKEAW